MKGEVRLLLVTAAVLGCGALSAESAVAPAGGYCVVVSRATREAAGWAAVVERLVEKHRGQVVVYESAVEDAAAPLRQARPRHTCFVARRDEATREFVARVHRLARALDDDPYADTLWGILTGYDADNALRIAARTEPLVIHRVLAGTEVELSLCDEGAWYCELVPGRYVLKRAGAAPEELRGPSDTTQALVDALNLGRAQLLITSGHATERDWAIGYRYANGSFRSEAGRLFGVDTAGRRLPIDALDPKVYLPVGNCLMGHIDGPDAMALAFMNSAGVCQMIGYTVPTWYGYAGWGCLDYFLEQPGRFTLAEAFFANHQALLHRLESCFPELAAGGAAADGAAAAPGPGPAARAAGLTANDGRGLLFDRDAVAFYGDPAWPARMAPGPLRWEQELTEAAGVYTLEVRPRAGAASFEPVSRNGSQRGGRPILEWLPRRVRDVRLLEGAELGAVVTDDFVLLPLPPAPADSERASYRVVFSAVLAD